MGSSVLFVVPPVVDVKLPDDYDEVDPWRPSDDSLEAVPLELAENFATGVQCVISIDPSRFRNANNDAFDQYYSCWAHLAKPPQ